MSATNFASKSMPGAGFLMLFSLPFAGVGIGMTVWLFSGIFAHWEMQGWTQTPARIVRAQLETHRGSKGGRTYKATAEYIYEFGGKSYTCNRLFIHGGSDNLGTYQQDAYNQLSEHEKSGRPFPCYVNPKKPANAILFRDLRWQMVGFQAIFATVFGSAGFGLFMTALLGFGKAGRDRAAARLHPDEPWLGRKDWADGQIMASGKTTVYVLLVCAFFWNVVSAPLWYVIVEEALGKGHRLAFLLSVFPAIGLILIACAVVAVLRWQKYGQSVFVMASVPGVIGGQLAGVIRVSGKVDSENGFRIAVNCVHRVTTGSGKSSRTTETSLWQDEQVIARDMLQNDPAHSAIPVLFSIPYECLPTDEANARDQTIWRLKVSAKTPGLDYSSTFEVPVFKTAESDPNFVVDRSLIAEYAVPQNPTLDSRSRDDSCLS